MDDLISRSEAIRVASGYCHWTNIPKELAKLPSVNPIPCEDAISRAMAKKIIKTYVEELDASDLDGKQYAIRGAKTVGMLILDLPPVSTEKTGRWITTRTFMHDGEYYCDKCKCDAPNNEKWDYCPNCGAKMLPQPYKEESEG